MGWRRAVVTGASSGIGAAMVERLAERGTPVVMVARSAERMEELAERIDVESEILPVDLGTPDGVAAVAARLASEDDPVDLLVNNAGFGHHGDFVDDAVEHQQAMVDLNVSALVQLTHAAAAVMSDRAGGTVLNVSSVAAATAAPGFAVYAATKAFVSSFSQAVHEELRERGVVVSCLAPGLTRTEFQDRASYDSSKLPDFAWQTAAEVAEAGLEGAAKGRAMIVPGAQNKLLVGGAKLMPAALQRRIAASI